MPRPTIKDVAHAAGVGIATVSRVVHRHPAVAIELRERVENAMEELGYQPSFAAQSLRTRSSRTIACAIRDIALPEFATFVKSAEAEFRSAGYTLILTNTDEEVAQELETIKLLRRHGIDGLMMTRSRDRLNAVDAAIASLGVPVVFIDRDPLPGTDSVLIDHRQGMEAAIDHLISLGHRRIALLTGRPETRPARERLQAYRDTLARNAIPIDDALISDRSFAPELGYVHAQSLLACQPRPTAIIAGGMALLAPVLQAIRQQGLQVGRDIAVIAGTDSDLAALADPAITAIRWDVSSWGTQAARLLLDRILSEGDLAHERQVSLATELVPRSSSTFQIGADGRKSVGDPQMLSGGSGGSVPLVRDAAGSKRSSE